MSRIFSCLISFIYKDPNAIKPVAINRAAILPFLYFFDIVGGKPVCSLKNKSSVRGFHKLPTPT